MDESFIFFDKGNDKLELYNSNTKINITYKKPIKLENNIQFYSQYLSVKHTEIKHNFCLNALFTQLAITYCLTYFSVNILAVDSFITALLYIADYYGVKQSFIYQAPYLLRLQYYVVLWSAYNIINFILWYHVDFILQLIMPIFLVPFIVEQIVYSYKFKLFTKKIDDCLKDFVYFTTSKQMGKVITMVSKECLYYDPQLEDNVFKPFVKKISINIFINFICSFLFAGVLHYFEQDGSTVYTMMFRQYYFGKYKKSSVNDREYVINVLKNKNWAQLLDPYTLNKIIQIYLSFEKKDSFAEKIKQCFDRFLKSFGKLASVWTISSIFNVNIILPFFIFINKKNIVIKTIVRIIFFLLTSDKILLLLVCEWTIIFLTNKIIQDVLYDMLKHIKIIVKKNAIFYIEHNTIILALFISTLFYQTNNIMNTIFIITFIFKITSLVQQSDKLQHMYIGSFNTLVFGCLSNYNIYHCLVLSYIGQLFSNKNKIK